MFFRMHDRWIRMQAISSLGTVALYVIDSYYLEPIYKAWATQTEVRTCSLLYDLAEMFGCRLHG